jgi:hypothetical protein
LEPQELVVLVEMVELLILQDLLQVLGGLVPLVETLLLVV